MAAERRNASDARRNVRQEKLDADTQPIAGWLLILSGDHKGEDFRMREG
ncbi:MAG: hypothetical protein ACYS22_08300 [Planctomycetota bacterium]|jgi:hypothetical protein